ncbi:TPA: M28 family peptidase [Candidatus Poribacteria bacterium]|nr:M28 family peptidase [Candidatus Poribacteria bacterium]
MKDPISELIACVVQDELSKNLFCLSKEPITYRKVNYTAPGHRKNSLYEADDYITETLESYGYKVEKEKCSAQAFRRDTSKPLASQYSSPMPEDPFYDIYNLYAKKEGSKYPDKIIVFIAHKDSQSWIDSPGAYDNAVGTVAIMEIARIIKDYPSNCSFWFIFCNEEHTPWTSVTAAQNAKSRGDNIVAVFNIDSLGGKSYEDIDSGKKTNVTLYTTPEGEKIADMMSLVNKKYKIGLDQRKCMRSSPGDDDGSFINAGFLNAIVNVGSFPYMDPNYHAETDIPEFVDIQNVFMSTKLSLACGVYFDINYKP